jgi:predicted DsbA family dithiol-disulfide isomerase
MAAITVQHYADILCIWAYVADARMLELEQTFGAQIEIEWRQLSVFGNVPGKMAALWGSKGGVATYAAHVHAIAAQHPHLTVHERVWQDNTPHSSLPAHLYLSALRDAERHEQLPRGTQLAFARALRAAFFGTAADIGSEAVLRAVLEAAGIASGVVATRLADGRAHAALAEDLQLAKELDIRSSPTLLFNDGRQRLSGNVGYRIIEANIRELLEHPEVGHSWC